MVKYILGFIKIHNDSSKHLYKSVFTGTESEYCRRLCRK